MKEFLQRLNTEQYNAATAELGHNLIIASAGTGKTSTIVARIAYLIDLGIRPERILLLTFTNKASTEMINRLNLIFDKSLTSKITAGTFHSVSLDMLKKLGIKLVLKQPSELKSLLKSIMDRRRFDQKSISASYLYDIYTLFLNKEIELSFYDYFCKNYPDHAHFVEIYDDIIKEYLKEKQKFQYGDFTDILLMLKQELRNNKFIEFDEILIDEYQDTNSLQGSLIDEFNTKSLFCVGDFDQSIYAFNGANIEIIGNFKNHYKDAKIYSLNINYRSSAPILALANKVINNNPRLYDKKLVVGKQDDEEISPKLLIYNDLILQYQEIAKRIKQSGILFDEIAVIFRNNSSADGIEIALKELEIPCVKKGGISVFDTKEIKFFLNLISLLLNDKDLMSFLQIFEFTPNLGESGAKEIFDNLIILGDGLRNGFLKPNKEAKIFAPKKKNHQLGLFDDMDKTLSLQRFNSVDINEVFKNHPILQFSKINNNNIKFLNALFEFFKNFNDDVSLISQLQYVKNSEIFAYLCKNLAKKRSVDKNLVIDEDKFNNELDRIYQKIDNLLRIAKGYDDLGVFFNFLTIGSKEMNNAGGVQLLSIHASKGLEFEMVFIIDLIEGRFPNQKLMSMGGSLEEERRLFYVAVTRAKKFLYLSYAKEILGKKTEVVPSIFLQEAGFL